MLQLLTLCRLHWCITARPQSKQLPITSQPGRTKPETNSLGKRNCVPSGVSRQHSIAQARPGVVRQPMSAKGTILTGCLLRQHST